MMVVGIPAKSDSFSNFILLSLVGVQGLVKGRGGWITRTYVRINCGSEGGVEGSCCRYAGSLLGDRTAHLTKKTQR